MTIKKNNTGTKIKTSEKTISGVRLEPEKLRAFKMALLLRNDTMQGILEKAVDDYLAEKESLPAIQLLKEQSKL